jgi:hypothetical protein
MTDGPVRVRLHVLVLCDEVEELPGGEDVFNLIGVRTHVRARSFPYFHPQLCVFFQVTGHDETTSGHLALVQEATDAEIFQLPIDTFPLSGPLRLIPKWIELQDCGFPEPGVYWFQVVLNGKLVMERRFHVITSPGDGNGQPT